MAGKWKKEVYMQCNISNHGGVQIVSVYVCVVQKTNVDNSI